MYRNEYSPHYRSLYRAILRGISKTRCIPSPFESVKNLDPQVQQEVKKSALNPELYHRHLFAEIRQLTWEEFSKSLHNVKDVAKLHRLTEAQALIDVFNHIKAHPAEPENWGQLLQMLVNYRSNQLKLYNWKIQYQENKQSIDQGLTRQLPPLVTKRMVSREQKAQKKEPKYSKMSASQKVKAYEKTLLESKENAMSVVRNYIKRRQLQGKYPNPYNLPYVRANMLAQSPTLPHTQEILPGSTKFSVMKDAYDLEYIESILKPEIEHRINETYFLHKYMDIINRKGPYKVQLRSTMAGIMPAHFLKLPYTRSGPLKALALDIKKSITSARIQHVWNANPSGANPVNEKRHGNGYSVRGCRGFSIDEVMFPRYHYESLAADEAAWEFRMSLLRLEPTFNQIKKKVPRVETKLQTLYEEIEKSWKDPLDVATREVDSEVSHYFEKHRVSKNSKVWEERRVLQSEMDVEHEKLIRRIETLASAIEKNNVGMHSDLYDVRFSQEKFNEARILEEKKVVTKKRRGIPESPTSRLGYTLGDYMEDAGLKAFKMGEKFDKRLSFLTGRVKR